MFRADLEAVLCEPDARRKKIHQKPASDDVSCPATAAKTPRCYKLPAFSFVIDGILQDTKDMYPLLAQAKEKPWSMDDATIHRTIRVYNERLEIVADNSEQIARWRKELLTARQKQEIDRLEIATAETKRLTQTILDLASQIKANTIDQILARDDAELALDVLLGKLKR